MTRIVSIARNQHLLKHRACRLEIAGQHHGGTLAAFGELTHHVGPLGEHEQLVGFLGRDARFLDGFERILDAQRDGLALVGDAFARLF